jgi:hypothetical protein
MELQSGGDSVVVVGSYGGGVVLKTPLGGGGGGGGHTSDPVPGDPWPASLAPVHGARVLVGLPLGPLRIIVVCRYADLSGESRTGMTSTGSSSSSSAVVTPSAPSLGSDDDNTDHLGATE